LTKTLSGNIDSGKDIVFLSQNVYIDIKEFLSNKLYDTQHSDVVIEIIICDKETNCVDGIFTTMCKVFPDYKNNKLEGYKIKPLRQKIKVNEQWFDITDVYGLNSEENECEICCCKRRNSIFLPCKHSYACKECAIQLRLRGNNCPICRIRNNNIT
jgi:hypothetical protein